jgi:hypothetical protein
MHRGKARENEVVYHELVHLPGPLSPGVMGGSEPEKGVLMLFTDIREPSCLGGGEN